MDRAELQRQLVLRLNGAVSREELSAWALRKVVENDNLTPPLDKDEHDFLEELLSHCAFQATDGFELSDTDIREMIERLRQP